MGLKLVRRAATPEEHRKATPARTASQVVLREEPTILRDEVPTRGSDAAVDQFVSHVDEIRRLYVNGEADAALDLASMVSKPAMGFSLYAIPVVVCTPEELLALPLDARSGFLLARIDGVSNLQTLLDISAMPESEAMSLVEELLALRAIRLVAPSDAEPATTRI